MFGNIVFLFAQIPHEENWNLFAEHISKVFVFTTESRYVWTGPKSESEYFFVITALVILISVIRYV